MREIRSLQLPLCPVTGGGHVFRSPSVSRVTRVNGPSNRRQRRVPRLEVCFGFPLDIEIEGAQPHRQFGSAPLAQHIPRFTTARRHLALFARGGERLKSAEMIL